MQLHDRATLTSVSRASSTLRGLIFRNKLRLRVGSIYISVQEARVESGIFRKLPDGRPHFVEQIPSEQVEAPASWASPDSQEGDMLKIVTFQLFYPLERVYSLLCGHRDPHH